MLYNLGNGFRNTTRAYVQTIQFPRGFIKLIFSNEYNQSSTNSNSSHSTRSYPIARLDLVNSIKIIVQITWVDEYNGCLEFAYIE